MKNPTHGLVTIALLIVVAALFVLAGVYIYAKHTKDNSENALINAAQNAFDSSTPPQTALEFYAEMAWAKTRLQMENDKLAKLKAEAGTSFIIEDALRKGFEKLSLAVFAGTDALFGNAKTNPNFIPTTKAAIEISINIKRAEINTILREWQELISSPSGGSSSSLAEAIQEDLPQIQEYLDELKDIIDTLTPGNSGLTQAEIDAYKVALAKAIADAEAAASALAAAQAAALAAQNGGANPPTPDVIQKQEEIIKEIEKEIEELEAQEPPPDPYTYDPYANTPGVQGSTIIIYPQAPAATRRNATSTGPSLIQGDNEN